jgi:serine/threonine-protein kinase
MFSVTIAPPQTQNLKTWIQQSQKIIPLGQSTVSKNWLKEQYKQMQAKIIKQLQT